MSSSSNGLLSAVVSCCQEIARCVERQKTRHILGLSSVLLEQIRTLDPGVDEEIVDHYQRRQNVVCLFTIDQYTGLPEGISFLGEYVKSGRFSHALKRYCEENPAAKARAYASSVEHAVLTALRKDEVGHLKNPTHSFSVFPEDLETTVDRWYCGCGVEGRFDAARHMSTHKYVN